MHIDRDCIDGLTQGIFISGMGSCHNKMELSISEVHRESPQPMVHLFSPHVSCFTSIQALPSTSCSCQQAHPPYHCSVFPLISIQRSPCIQTTPRRKDAVLSVPNLKVRLPPASAFNHTWHTQSACCLLPLVTYYPGLATPQMSLAFAAFYINAFHTDECYDDDVLKHCFWSSSCPDNHIVQTIFYIWQWSQLHAWVLSQSSSRLSPVSDVHPGDIRIRICSHFWELGLRSSLYFKQNTPAVLPNKPRAHNYSFIHLLLLYPSKSRREVTDIRRRTGTPDI